MLTKETCQPKFRIVERFPLYGSRDEIIGYRTSTVATACTQGYAEFQHGELFDRARGEAWLEIVNTRPLPRKSGIDYGELPF